VHDHHHLTNLATQSGNNYSFAVNKGFERGKTPAVAACHALVGGDELEPPTLSV